MLLYMLRACTYRHTGRAGCGDACVLTALLAESVGSPPSAELSRGELGWSSCGYPCTGSTRRRMAGKKRGVMRVVGMQDGRRCDEGGRL